MIKTHKVLKSCRNKMSAITYALAIILCSIPPPKGDAGIVSFPHFLLGERFLKKTLLRED